MHIIKRNGWKNINLVNNNQKKTGVAILNSDRTDFRARKVTKNRGALQNDK